MARAFIVGNGPSLRNTNLDKLIGEVSFGCNNVHLIYKQTKWRPTHYIRGEEAGYLEPEPNCAAPAARGLYQITFAGLDAADSY